MFRLIHSHLQADSEDTKEMLTAAWEVWDIGPYFNLRTNFFSLSHLFTIPPSLWRLTRYFILT